MVVPELPRTTEMRLGQGSAGQGLRCLWQRAPQVRKESLLSTEAATRGRWQFSDEELRSLCTVALSPRELQSGGDTRDTGLRKKFGVGGNDVPIA